MKKGNEISHLFHQGSDLVEREQEVLSDVSSRLNIEVGDLFRRSYWWGSKEAGAIFYKGTFEGVPVVLKIQGVKPATSEAEMIKSFESQNESSLIRPPKLYAALPWNNDKRYEALIIEDVGTKVLISKPTTEQEVTRFFGAYREYRAKCINNPWLDKPEENLSQETKNNFEKWRKAREKIYPDHPHSKQEDAKLIDEAIRILSKGYEGVGVEFLHGHFGTTDLYEVGNQLVLLSNLYWRWAAPYYDTIFGYHWYIYQLGEVEGITPEKIEEQRELWMEHIRIQVPQEDERLLNLAFLERATAGLTMDSLASDPKVPISNYLVEATRIQMRELMAKIG